MSHLLFLSTPSEHDGNVKDEAELFQSLPLCPQCNERCLGLVRYSGVEMCEDCEQTWKAQDQENRVEKNFVEAFAKMPMDFLITLEWMAANTFIELGKKDCENVVWFSNMVREAKEKHG
jgi:hypothetical protein